MYTQNHKVKNFTSFKSFDPNTTPMNQASKTLRTCQIRTQPFTVIYSYVSMLFMFNLNQKLKISFFARLPVMICNESKRTICTSGGFELLQIISVPDGLEKGTKHYLRV